VPENADVLNRIHELAASPRPLTDCKIASVSSSATRSAEDPAAVARADRDACVPDRLTGTLSD
jgi:hypothetical protein